MAKIELRNIHKVFFGGNQAVNGLNLTIEDQEFVVLVGPSGCGKTTTLRMVAGLEKCTAGDILIGDRRVNNAPPIDRGVAMVFQNYALYPQMTVYKNMAFGLKLRKYADTEIEERVLRAAAMLDLADVLNRLPRELSGGQRQRAAVGRAIVRDPHVFLFDEPFSNLDVAMRAHMRAEFIKLRQQLKTTTIYVTHDQVEAMTMGDRIVVMREGKVQQVAKPLDLYFCPANRFVAGFIGNPPMNFLEGRLYVENGSVIFRSADGAVNLTVPQTKRAALEAYAAKEITLGLRPQDFVINPRQSPTPGGSIQGSLQMVEPLGPEVHVHLALSGVPITAAIKSRQAPRPGENLVLDINMNNAHFFDPQTQMAIT